MNQDQFNAYVKQRDAEKAKRVELAAAANAEREVARADFAALGVQQAVEAADRRDIVFAKFAIIAAVIFGVSMTVIIGVFLGALMGVPVVVGIMVFLFLVMVFGRKIKW